MNVLFTAAGRRNYLLEYFREAIRPAGKILAADASLNAPALAEADEQFALPPFDDGGYIEAVLRICRERHVDLVVPLNDFELPLYAEARPRFLACGAFPLVPSIDVVETCLDKLATYRFLRHHGVVTPETYGSSRDTRAALMGGSLNYPLVLKPRWGSGSRGVYVVHDDRELRSLHRVAVSAALRLVPRNKRLASPDNALIVQQHLDGEEFGIDVVNDFEGRFAGVLGRRKLLMRSGETDRAVTSADSQWVDLGRRLSGTLRHAGNLDCDVIVEAGCPYVLEMNPRIGGGYPFNHAAGANLPAAIVAWAQGQRPDPAWLRTEPGVVVAKCDRVVRAAVDVRTGLVATTPPERSVPSHKRPARRRPQVLDRTRVAKSVGSHPAAVRGTREALNLLMACAIAAAHFLLRTAGA